MATASKRWPGGEECVCVTVCVCVCVCVCHWGEEMLESWMHTHTLTASMLPVEKKRPCCITYLKSLLRIGRRVQQYMSYIHMHTHTNVQKRVEIRV